MEKKNIVKKITNQNKGFTLIELLAVIIILGILMIIAIPSVTKYISDSRKSSYVDTAKEIISGARNKVNDGKLGMFDTNATYYIPVSYIKTENALKSPYGDFTEAYVVVTYDGKGYKYYWISVDDAGQGVKNIISYDELNTDDIESDIKDSDITNVVEHSVIGNRNKILILEPTTETWREPVGEITNHVPEEGSSGGSSAGPICKAATTLHTATCTKTSMGCYSAGYRVGGKKNTTTITYGKIWNGTSALSSGDALDCDVNGNGTYDERFYYVTSSGSGEDKKAILIYYANISNDGTTITKPSQTAYKYCSDNKNWLGPNAAVEQLPSTSQWSNSKIIAPESNRQITTITGGTKTDIYGYDGGGPFTIQPFTYTGKVARLLTYQELVASCGSNVTSEGALDNCNFIMENVGQYESTTAISGYWLESPTYDHYNEAYCIYGSTRSARHDYVTTNSIYGVRPVIEVLESNISG